MVRRFVHRAMRRCTGACCRGAQSATVVGLKTQSVLAPTHTALVVTSAGATRSGRMPVIPGSFSYHRPSSVQEAVGLLAKLGDDCRALAGGHSLIPMMK